MCSLKPSGRFRLKKTVVRMIFLDVPLATDKPNLRPSVRARLSERLATLERAPPRGSWGLAAGLHGLHADPDAAREDALLEAVGELEALDPREALEFRLAQMRHAEEEAADEAEVQDPEEGGRQSQGES